MHRPRADPSPPSLLRAAGCWERVRGRRVSIKYENVMLRVTRRSWPLP